jgi:peptidoglycan DL-endopeptidase CwlO
MKNHTKFSALATTTLLIVAMAGPANATAPEEPTVETASQPVLAPIEADPIASVTFEKPTVTTVKRVQVSPVPVTVEAAPTEQTPVASKVTQPQQPKAVAGSPTPVTSAPTPSAAPVASSGKGAKILSAAMAQLGITQDCTMLVTNALSAVGIHFHDWPAGYLSLGSVVPASAAQPGDLIYYADGGGGMAHIAVYAGNGMAVHGGFNGNQTIVFSAYVPRGSAPVFIRVA